MEANAAKRRKLDQTNGGPSFEAVAPSFDAVAPIPEAISTSFNAVAPSTSSMGASGASAFVLETEELLKEVKWDYGNTVTSFEDTLRQFKDAIEASEPHPPVSIVEMSAEFESAHRIAIPYPDPKPAKGSPYKVTFQKPARVNIVGSWVLKTNIKSQTDMAVDMIVEMPTSVFQEKDYLNMRYFYKRAYYLAYIITSLRHKVGTTMEFTFDYLGGNVLLPILVARPKDGSKDPGHKTHPAIRVIPCAPEGYFPAAKLTAISNAIRQGKLEDVEDAKVPTPFYNNTLKAEGQFSSYLRLLYRTAKSCPSFKDACVLGRIWLQQRGFNGSIQSGGFGHFEWAVLMALLLQGGGRKGEAVLSTALHSTQLFKATLQYISSANLQTKSLVIGENAPNLDTLRQSLPILYDAARETNVLYKMTPWSIAMLSEHARWSLLAISDSPLDQLGTLFIVKANQPLQVFDMLLSVKASTSKQGFRSADSKGLLMDFSAKVYNTLKRALGERAQLIHIDIPETSQWLVSTVPPKTKGKSLLVGIIIDPLKASQSREYGPAYEQKKEAAKFREFWGEKADLWQFPDGNIVESVDWTEHSYLGFPGICEAIIRYILKLQLQLGEGDLEFGGREMSTIMPVTPSDKTAFDAAKQAFEMFERDVRDLEDLPLHVKQIAPICSDLRHTSVQIPEFNFKKPLVQPMEVVISFEISGKWPENLAAVQRAKVAFLLKIGSSLEANNEEVRTHLGLENGTRDDENLAFLDVIYDNGASFRLRVHSDLEEALLDRLTKDQNIERYIRTEAAELLAAHRRTYTNLPLHNQTVSTYCTRLPALSPSIRLTKLWLNSHKLSCHFSEELIELFVLQAFLKPYPWTTPCSATTGFLRTLLLLSKWDWRDEPLIVDSSGSLSTSQRIEIGTRLEAWRKIDPNMNRTVLFVATSHDVTGTAYTLPGPSKVIASRMTSLARSACKVVKDNGADLNIRRLFHPMLSDYDVLFHLSPRVIHGIMRDDMARRSQFKNLAEQHVAGKAAMPLAEHPTRTLLRQLKTAFDGPLLFFHGGPDDMLIAALWNPLLHRRTFTVHMPCSLKKVEDESGSDAEGKGKEAGTEDGSGELFEVNKDDIIAEIARIGGDLIEKIQVREEN
ncbi:Nrap protein [Hypoxylon crocopeplum]|nr:Nrap protein [Hypoxylon crocopeplum]